MLLVDAVGLRRRLIPVIIAITAGWCFEPVSAQDTPPQPAWVAPTTADPLHLHFPVAGYQTGQLPDDGPRYQAPPSGEGHALFSEAVQAYEQDRRSEAQAAFDRFIQDHPRSPLLPSARAFRAELLLSQNRTARSTTHAIDLYRTILRDAPNTPNASRARWRMGDLYAEDGFLVEARSHYERGLADSSIQYDTDRSLLGLAFLLMRGQQWKEAEQSFQLLRQRAEDETLLQHATLGLADALYAQERFSDAQPLYATTLFRWPGWLKRHPTSLLAFADTLMTLRQDSAARKVYLLYYNLYPTTPEAPHVLIRVADSFREVRQRQLAAIFYGRVHTTHPNTPSADLARMRLAVLGQAILAEHDGKIPEWVGGTAVRRPAAPMTDVKEIRSTLEGVAAARQQEVLGSEALFHLARFYEWRGEHARAVETFQRLIARAGALLFDPWPARGAQRLSERLKPWVEAALDAGDAWTAVTLFHRLGAAGQYVYEGTPLQVKMADAHRLLGFPDHAITLYQAAIRNAQSQDVEQDALLGLGQAYLEQQDHLAARGVLERYRLQYPLGRWRAEAEHVLAHALYGQGETERVVRLCRKWLARHKTHLVRADMWLLLARAAADLGRAAESVTAYAQADQAGRVTTPETMTGYADALRRAGRATAAAQWYRRAIEAATLPAELQRARLGLARALADQGRAPDARRILDTIATEATDPLTTQVVAVLRDDLARKAAP